MRVAYVITLQVPVYLGTSMIGRRGSCDRSATAIIIYDDTMKTR